ncbi:MAG: 3-hydroxyacyl-CoA dehydrogenase NAD-binding domain-containing protein [Woeseiaceae bacterium]|nr:3-hydroxyacyl-CoA dehydrogenase NAD-binding domain-containing protein [Woeseiaceae bacterium]
MNSPVSYEIDAGIGIVTVDNPPVNALSQAVRQGILEAVTAAQTDDSDAIVLRCAGRTFIAGADITEFGKPIEPPFLPDLINAIEASGKIVVAALFGTALGGGFETALGCHYRIALATAQVGFPEVKLGLIPGAGGTQRTPRLAGIRPTVELMASGTPIAAEQAAELGLVDRVVADGLDAAAAAYARELVDTGAPLRRTRDLDVEALDAAGIEVLEHEVARRAKGQIAPLKVVECVRAAADLAFDSGLAKEREVFTALMDGPQSRALRHVFFAEREAAKVADLPRDTGQREVGAVGIVGAGTMGGGIAMSFANAGFPVTLLEVDDEALARGLETIDRNYAGSVKRGKLAEADAAACRGRISGTTDYAALAAADLVIEAVFEDPELKKTVFGRLDAACKPGAILATNTSYQDVDAIARATGRPADVLGMHFFSPAHIMKLLEVVRGEATAPDVLATVMALAKRIRKVPVLARVCYGFIGNRMLGPYFREAQLCLVEGATPAAVDSAMEDWGMAMGPIAVGDLAGLDVGYKARQALPEAERGDPRACRVPDVLVEAGRLGQKTGKGFYRYDPGTRARESDPEVEAIIEREARALGVERREITKDEIVDRLVYALVNEGMRILEEGIAQRPGDIDVVYIYGYGFPAWRGGPMHYADETGLDTVLARTREFERRFGAAWTPAPLLEALVADGRRIADLAS